MAHMMKHTKASCGHMFAHFDRKAEHICNENLDRTRTHLNYNLAIHQEMDQGEFVRKVCRSPLPKPKRCECDGYLGCYRSQVCPNRNIRLSSGKL